MIRFFLFLAVLSLPLASLPALAQSSAEPPNLAGGEPVAPTPSAPPPLEAARPPAPAAPLRAAAIACLVGEYPPQFPDSARTATGLVCEALRARGLDVGAPSTDPAGAASAYVVSLDQLGSSFFLRVEYEEPVGQVRASRKAMLNDLAEAQIAAPRLAAALTGGVPVEQTATYESVVGSETRRYEKRSGEFVIGGGIAGVSMPSAGVLMAPTVNLFAFYETNSWGIGLQLHLRDADETSFQKASLNSLSVGARYFFNDTNVTPLVGMGLSIATISEYGSNASPYDELQGSGTTAYAEAGVEVFRLHQTHLIATLRVDAPFFGLNPDLDSSSCYDGSCGYAGTQQRYELPVSVNVGIGF